MNAGAHTRAAARGVHRLAHRAAAVLPCLLLLAGPGRAQRSPFNGLEVPPADSTGHHRILIGGHFHGESTNRSGFPAATLLANLDTINSLGAQLFLSTGDLFMDPVKDRPRYERSLFRKLRMPFFNAPGNHDRPGRGAHDTALAEGRYGSWAFILLDTEARDGRIDPARLARMEAIAAGVRTLFVIAHRPLWAEDDPRYADLFKDNTRSTFGNGFQQEVYPVLARIAQHTHVYWIGGSLGGSAPSSIFFQPHAPNITYIQCAIRDEPRDALLIADVHPDTVTWSALSLTGAVLEPPPTYDADWWRARRGGTKAFHWRLLPYLIKATVLHRAFWWGVGLTLLLLLLVRRILRR